MHNAKKRWRTLNLQISFSEELNSKNNLIYQHYKLNLRRKMSSNAPVSIITGASTGIGLATRQLLSAKGQTVYNLDFQDPEDGGHFIFCDVRKKTSVQKAVAEVFEKEGRIDHVFANAGIHLFANLEETSEEELNNLIATNILGTFYLLQEVIPTMKAKGYGRIVLMGSDQSFVGKGSSAAYGLTKGATAQLTKSTAIDYAPYNILVNCICPGTIETPLLHKAVAHFSKVRDVPQKQVYRSLDTIQPLGRIGQPKEIAEVVVFLLSEQNSFMTGSIVAADGGYVCQ
jgi:NAD(P)-dependent dehydrogenase (short-subunit alcohol dehydrogenase family)